jgi:hypothetical protein
MLIDAIKRKIVIVLLSSLLFVSRVSAYIYNNTTWGGGPATQNLTYVDQSLYENLTMYIGGNITNATMTATPPNFGMIIYDSVLPYTQSIGPMGWVILFAMPFVGMVIVGPNITLAAIVGMVLSVFIFAKIGATYVAFAVACFIISTAALIYSLVRR